MHININQWLLHNYFQNGDLCNPLTFSQNCFGRTTYSFLRQTNPCLKAACRFKQIESPYFIGYFHAWNVVGFFWVVCFISAFGEMVLAATFATWYWTFHKSNVPFFTLLNGLTRTVRYKCNIKKGQFCFTLFF